MHIANNNNKIIKPTILEENNIKIAEMLKRKANKNI